MKTEVIGLLQKFKHHDLISGSMFVLMGSMVGNFFAFLLNLFLARHLTTSAYGVYASLLSILMLVVLLPTAFSTTLVQFATQYFAKKDIGKAKTLYQHSALFLSFLGGILCIGFIIFSPVIGGFLQVQNSVYIVMLGFLILLSYMSIANNAYLQSILAFGYMSIITTIGIGIKLIGGVLFIVLGWGIFGVLIAVGLSIGIPFLLSFSKLTHALKGTYTKTRIPIIEMLQYGFPSAVAVIALTSFVSTDLILAKHFLPATQAGLYAGTALIGKVILYFTSSIPVVMFPILIHRKSKGQGVQNTFYLGLLLVGIPSVFLTIIYMLFPQAIITIFLGAKQYLAVSGVVGLMAIFISLYSVLGVMVNFFLSQKQTRIVWPIVAMALLQIMGITYFHKNILEIIMVSLVVTGILIILLELYYLYHGKILKTYTSQENFLQEM